MRFYIGKIVASVAVVFVLTFCVFITVYHPTPSTVSPAACGSALSASWSVMAPGSTPATFLAYLGHDGWPTECSGVPRTTRVRLARVAAKCPLALDYVPIGCNN